MSMLLSDQYLPTFGKNWGKFLFWGIVLIILGLIAISAATFTTLISIVFLGVIIFLSGIILAFDTFSFWWGKWGGFFMHLLFTILYLVAGFMLIKNPLVGSISITLILGIFYIIAGIIRLGFSSVIQAPRWGWAWFNGLVTLLLGILILMSWPQSSLFIIGLFVGIDLLFCGWTYIMIALAGKKVIA